MSKIPLNQRGRGTLTVPSHTLPPSEGVGSYVYRQTEEPPQDAAAPFSRQGADGPLFWTQKGERRFRRSPFLLSAVYTISQNPCNIPAHLFKIPHEAAFSAFRRPAGQ